MTRGHAPHTRRRTTVARGGGYGKCIRAYAHVRLRVHVACVQVGRELRVVSAHERIDDTKGRLRSGGGGGDHNPAVARALATLRRARTHQRRVRVRLHPASRKVQQDCEQRLECREVVALEDLCESHYGESRHITSHSATSHTSHHMTSKHITAHHITPHDVKSHHSTSHHTT